MKVAVIGSGAWGTALAIRLHKNGHNVIMWTYEKALIPEMDALPAASWLSSPAPPFPCGACVGA